MELATNILLVQAIFLATVITPGPDFIVISSTALNSGRWQGLATASGTTLGMSVWVVAAMTGISFVFDHLFVLATALRIAGGLYLLYLAVQLIRRSFRGAPPAAAHETVKRSGWHAFRRGPLVNLGNPKALALFTSLAALLVRPDTPAWALAVSGAGITTITFVWYVTVVLALTYTRIRARHQATPKVAGPDGGRGPGYLWNTLDRRRVAANVDTKALVWYHSKQS